MTNPSETIKAPPFAVERGRNVDLPAVSVVAIGRNEGQRLVACLESIKASDYPAERLELIYVDTNSTDESCSAAERLGAKVIRIQPEFPSAAAARNAGLREATHDLVHFLDGDTVLDAFWLRKAVETMRDPTIVCVFGRREEMAPTATVYNFWTHHDWYVSPGSTGACGGDALFRREALETVGGYDAGLIAGEERDLCFRLLRDSDVSIIRLDEPMTMHDIHMTRFSQYWKRCFRSGYAYAQVASRYKGLRAWRRTCYRNVAHAAITLVAIISSITIGSWWPLAVWLALAFAAILRGAFRHRAQVGGMGGAILYALHHYLSKAPIVLGHADFALRSVFKGKPKTLVEYRDG
ncbi:MAG: glycosyltransferase [Planctomycetes bacterium]|nr:glycosyltransferase [Planctomycetota bacterium]